MTIDIKKLRELEDSYVMSLDGLYNQITKLEEFVSAAEAKRDEIVKTLTDKEQRIAELEARDEATAAEVRALRAVLGNQTELLDDAHWIVSAVMELEECGQRMCNADCLDDIGRPVTEHRPECLVVHIKALLEKLSPLEGEPHEG